VSAVLALAIAAVILADSPSHSSSTHTSTAAGSEQAFNGATLPGTVSAPDFKLTDQGGRRIALTGYRGQVVVLTFLYSTCGDTCVVIAQQIRGALNELADEHVRPPAVLIVSADPAADTSAHITRFLSGVSLLGRVRYLTGTLARLRSVWRAYGVKPASAGAQEFDEYAPVLLLDPAGRKRVLFESEELTPEGLSQDIRKLDGDPTHP
jgi:protein SCO1